MEWNQRELEEWKWFSSTRENREWMVAIHFVNRKREEWILHSLSRSRLEGRIFFVFPFFFLLLNDDDLDEPWWIMLVRWFDTNQNFIKSRSFFLISVCEIQLEISKNCWRNKDFSSVCSGSCRVSKNLFLKTQKLQEKSDLIFAFFHENSPQFYIFFGKFLRNLKISLRIFSWIRNFTTIQKTIKNIGEPIKNFTVKKSWNSTLLKEKFN